MVLKSNPPPPCTPFPKSDSDGQPPCLYDGPSREFEDFRFLNLICAGAWKNTALHGTKRPERPERPEYKFVTDSNSAWIRALQKLHHMACRGGRSSVCGLVERLGSWDPVDDRRSHYSPMQALRAVAAVLYDQECSGFAVCPPAPKYQPSDNPYQRAVSDSSVLLCKRNTADYILRHLNQPSTEPESDPLGLTIKAFLRSMLFVDYGT